jgi:hypothetical protein
MSHFYCNNDWLRERPGLLVRPVANMLTGFTVYKFSFTYINELAAMLQDIS